MNNIFRITLFSIFVGIILFNSCSETNPVSATETVKEKQKEISEIGTTFLPNDILDSYLNVSGLPENEQIKYLDTLKVAFSTFRDTLLTYYSIQELEQAFNRVNQASAKLKRKKGFKNDAELFNYIRLGYGKSAQLSLGGSSGFAATVGASLNTSGGGGIEVLYDFVNMDREVYTTRFCYLGGSVLIGGEVDIKSFEVGFSGINKWVLDINTREGVGKFEGASRGASFGVSKEIQTALGLSAGISLSRTQDVLANGNFSNASVCPSGFAFDPNPSGVKEYSFETNVNVSGGLAAGITAAIEGGVLGSYRNVVDDSYTSFRREINGRRIAAFNMAKELLVHTFVSGVTFTPSATFDLSAVIFALKYGAITYEDFESVSPSIVVAPDLINAPVTASKHYINISNIGSGNLEWLVTTEEEWIEIGERNGSGEDKIEIKILENTTESLRTGEILINSNGGDDQTILIKQESPADEGSNVTFSNFGVTGNRYAETSDWDQIVLDDFGSDYRVADWTDLKKYYDNGGDLLELFDGLGLNEHGSSASVTRNGVRNYSSWRYYFATRHEGNKPGNYLAHDNINNFEISLGSWDGNRPILAKKLESTPHGGIYSENFESDPDFTVKYSKNTEGKANIYWDDNAENYYASVMDQSDTWFSLGYRPVFTGGIDPNITDFIISFEFNPIEPDWGHYPGIYFLESGDIESPHELQRALQFTINWSDNIYKKFRLIGFSDDDNNQFLSPTIPKENEWYTVQIIYKSDVEKIDLTIEREDGSMFVDVNNLDIQISNPFNQLAIGEIQGPTKYGSKSVIRIDNISIKEQ